MKCHTFLSFPLSRYFYNKHKLGLEGLCLPAH